MKLTKTDKLILSSYASMLDGLADYLGPGYEIVLHSLEDLDRSVIKIINGYHSNRKEGSPITDLALSMLTEIKHSDKKHQFRTYFNRSENGIIIKSSTIPIAGEKDRIIGLICSNYYTDTPLNSIIEALTPQNIDNQIIKETFSDDIDELILSTLESAKAHVYNDSSISSTNKNREILSILYDKGIFNLKDAVPKVANNLGISKNTVYMHLRNFASH
ncbi:PAS domain-containing protein [Clostridiaceae bacterium Marseille-Q4143]|nr:PAS domain-containing protein [Clostridiaceae bacterium Marseille-Q4143]